MSGHVYCARCHAESVLVLEMTPQRVAEIVRAFVAEHTHGPVIVQTPGPKREPSARWKRGLDAERKIPCAWCSRRTATRLDEQCDPICEGCHGRAA